MANIELVIKIPESIWVAIQNGKYYGILDDRTYNAIKSGILLPKGYGDLIDRNDLLKEKRCFEDFDGDTFNIIYEETVINADTIIAADNAESEER